MWRALVAWMAVAAAQESDFTARCPAPCACRWLSGSKAASCIGADLRAVPHTLSPEIQTLDLAANRIHALGAAEFSRAGLRNLQRLSLRSCGVASLHADAFLHLAILIELDLSRNHLRRLPADAFRHAPRLRRLDLSENQISSLPVGTIRRLGHMQRVTLTDNALETLPVGVFTELPRLHTLRLDGNKMRALDPDVFAALPTLTSLDLHSNPWHCDCRLRVLREYTLARNLYTPPTACESPPRLARRLWSEVAGADMACAPRMVSPPRDELPAVLSESATLVCAAEADPAPRLRWLREDRALLDTERVRVQRGVEDRTSFLRLTFESVRVSDRGNYTCVADNVAGEARAFLRLAPELANGGTSAVTLAPIGVGAALAVIVCVLLALRRRGVPSAPPLIKSEPPDPPPTEVPDPKPVRIYVPETAAPDLLTMPASGSPRSGKDAKWRRKEIAVTTNWRRTEAEEEPCWRRRDGADEDDTPSPAPNTPPPRLPATYSTVNSLAS